MTSKKPAKSLSSAGSSRAFVCASQLMGHSLAQAQTAGEMCVALAVERVRLLCPETDGFDIRRLREFMIDTVRAQKPPIDALRAVAQTGRLHFKFSIGEGRPSPTLRAACKVVLAELEAAFENLPATVAGLADELPDAGPSFAAAASRAKAPGA